MTTQTRRASVPDTVSRLPDAGAAFTARAELHLAFGVEVEPVVQSLEADPQNLRRLLLVAGALLESRQDERPLGFLERLADLARGRRVVTRGDQVRQLDHAVAHDECPLQLVLDFAHVATPWVGPDALLRAGAQRLGRPMHGVERIQELPGEAGG